MHYEKHTRGLGSYIKDIVYGANDGIITTFAVVAGTIGASLDPTVILILGFSNLIADGFSMAASNFLGSRSENQLFEEEEQREYQEIETMPDRERQEIRQIFQSEGYDQNDTENLVRLVSKNKKFWVDFMMRYELGLHQNGSRQELVASTLTFAAFVISGSLPLLPFLLFSSVADSLLVSIAATAIALFVVGALRVLLTKKNVVISGLEMLTVGGIAAAVAYVIGYLVSRII
ncbi:MAG TPA: VIT1/CCC1 transporter family protein [Candidatus Paceibacterota bacterium]